MSENEYGDEYEKEKVIPDLPNFTLWTLNHGLRG